MTDTTTPTDTYLDKINHSVRAYLPEHPMWLLPLAAVAEEPSASILDMKHFANVLVHLDGLAAVDAPVDDKVASGFAFWRWLTRRTGWAWMRPVLTAYAQNTFPTRERMRTLDVAYLFTAGQLFRMPRRLEEGASEHRARMRAEAGRIEIDGALEADPHLGNKVREKVIRAVAEAGPLTREETTFLLAILRWAEGEGASALSWATGLSAEIDRLVPFPTVETHSLATFALFTATEIVRRG